jgi:hypothetical protein
MVWWDAEDPPARFLVPDRGMSAADTQVRASQHHGHGRLAEVVVIYGPMTLVLRFRENEDNRCSCLREVTSRGPYGR